MEPLTDEHPRRARVQAVSEATHVVLAVDLGFGIVMGVESDLPLLEPLPVPADRHGAMAWTFDWLEFHANHAVDPTWPLVAEIEVEVDRYWSVLTCTGCHKVLNTELVRAGRVVPGGSYRNPSVG